MLVERGYIEEVDLGIPSMREEMASLGLPEPGFREDGFSFVITFRSIAPREGIIVSADPIRALLEQGEINERQYAGLSYAREHGSVARREYGEVTGTTERTAMRATLRISWQRACSKWRAAAAGGPRTGCGEALLTTRAWFTRARDVVTLGEGEAACLKTHM